MTGKIIACFIYTLIGATIGFLLAALVCSKDK